MIEQCGFAELAGFGLSGTLTKRERLNAEKGVAMRRERLQR